MRLRWIILPALLTAIGGTLLSGCADVAQERVRDFTLDGNDRFQQGAYASAEKSYQVALSLKPSDADLLYHVGQCQDRLGELDQAEHTYGECLRQQADHVECRHALVSLLLKQKRLAEAEQMVEEWYGQARDGTEALIEDGLLARYKGDPTRALKRFQQAIDRDSRNTRAMVEMGRTFEEDLHYPERALALYELALAYDPGQTELRQRVTALKARGIGQPRPN